MKMKRVIVVSLLIFVILGIVAYVYVGWSLNNQLPKGAELFIITFGGIIASVAAIVTITGYDIRTIFSNHRKGILKNQVITTTDRSNLPAKPYSRLVGRDEPLEKSLSALRDPNGPQFISISGIGGIGKTAIAYEIADRCLQEKLFYSVLWFSAKQQVVQGRHVKNIKQGYSSLDDVIDNFYDQLMLDLDVKKFDMKLNLIQQHVKAQPYLLILDNLETLKDNEKVINLFANLLNPSRAVLTSRQIIDNSSRSYNIKLKGLEEAKSIEFTRLEANERGVSSLAQGSDTLLKTLHRETGGMPLAIKLVISEVLSGLNIDEVLKRLRIAKDEEEIYRFIYLDLWTTLSNNARQVLVTMPAFASSVNAQMLQRVSALPDSSFDVAIMELIDRSLLESTEPGGSNKVRYSIHALTRNFLNCDLPKLFESSFNPQHSQMNG
jgi:hypothetical protein